MDEFRQYWRMSWRHMPIGDCQWDVLTSTHLTFANWRESRCVGECLHENFRIFKECMGFVF